MISNDLEALRSLIDVVFIFSIITMVTTVEAHSEAYKKQVGVSPYKDYVFLDVADTYHVNVSSLSAYRCSHFYGRE